MTLNELAHLSNELLAELDTFFVMLSAEEPPTDEDLRVAIEDLILAAEDVQVAIDEVFSDELDEDEQDKKRMNYNEYPPKISQSYGSRNLYPEREEGWYAL